MEKFKQYIYNTHFSVDTRDVICKMFEICRYASTWPPVRINTDVSTLYHIYP